MGGGLSVRIYIKNRDDVLSRFFYAFDKSLDRKTGNDRILITDQGNNARRKNSDSLANATATSEPGVHPLIRFFFGKNYFDKPMSYGVLYNGKM
ncbi:hypothetical protein A2303_04945 [Candidatus Falkowbacteria bacterium RIFOXYB2_FULL_47_14]|uniref:Uncharacterized protein n=1 Tax=Candidatus Falkowbacteria bacterium RIFOXYA2_FULL_47_19 TaxID=1797994 RepID=A0A1F5SHG5_9BACT|nr:MAG: hypothetical protein A2227_02780 [Candidatus Falkowbacteria bacterium RIFOXYA2_FULL_47_19]OGF34333.1 MAG: hypothetical protein A2468_04285 [Candidatus Falkowbacteria bacterium RIFOXYC2_FULL_46_15]OGF42722.1 MAG: hypothetical protein A2303_04945 [Candidatus Falkowbacteria bacterium RIFOXYB2_FULL_47_14]